MSLTPQSAVNAQRFASGFFYAPHTYSHTAAFRVFFPLRSEIYCCLATRNGSRFSVATLNNSSMNANNSLALPKQKAGSKYHFRDLTKMFIKWHNTYIAPEGCEIKTKADAWYAATCINLVVFLIIPYWLPVPVACLLMAKRAERKIKSGKLQTNN